MNEEAKKNAKIFKETLKKHVCESDWSLYLEGMEVKTISDQEISLAFENAFTKDQVNTNDKLKKSINETIELLFNESLKVNFILLKPDKSPIKTTNTSEEISTTKKTASLKTKKQDFLGLELNPHYTFENFIVGENNNFSAALAKAIVKNPGKNYNPVLFFGGVGLGKTHLLQAIGNEIAKEDLAKKIIYTNASDFVNEFISGILAIKGNNNHDLSMKFKQKYRSADILLIDDIQFLQGKDQTQEELFLIFNKLYESNKQIVFTCDRPISELHNFTDRLKNRFTRGTTADLQPPKYETRLAILKHNLFLRQKENPKIYIPNEVLEFLAKNIVLNIRDLEGALSTLIGYSDLLNLDISIELAKEKIQINLANVNQTNITLEKIADKVSSFYGISIGDLRSKKRSAQVTTARQICMYLSRELTDFSLTEIGNFYEKDHSTVIHSEKQIKGKIKTDPSLEQIIDNFNAQLKS